MTNGNTPCSPGWPRTVALRTLVAILLLTGVAAVLVTTAMDLVWFRDVGYPDSASLLRIGEYLHNGTIYPDPNRPPYLASLYGPLFYILLSVPYRLADGVDAIRVFVRLGIAGFWIASLTIVFLIVRRLSRSTKRSISAIVFASAPGVIAHWTTQIRSDMLGVTFSLLGIYFVLGEDRYWRLLAGAACTVLALLCKQTFVPAPLAVALYLLWRRRFGYALVWGAAVCVGTALGYGIIIWKEPYAWRELTTLAKPIYSFRTGMSLASQGLWNGATLFALFGICAARKSCAIETRLVLIYCSLSWLVAVALIMQVGGSTNYFLEPLTASAILAAMTFPDIENAVKNMPRVFFIPATLAVLCFFVPLLIGDSNLIKDGIFRKVHYYAFRGDWKAFTSSIVHRPLLSSYPDVTIFSKTPQVPDTLLNSVLAERGAWSWNPVIESLNRSDYELLVMYPFFLSGSGQYRGIHYWNGRIFEAILRNYELAGLCAGMEIWTPRNARRGSWRYLAAEGCNPPDR